jgi:hypothetical protein
MSKAVEGAALIAGFAALEVFDFMATGGTTSWLIAEWALQYLATPMLLGGASLLAGSIADSLSSNRGMGITTRQPAAYRQIILGGDTRVGGISIYESTTGSSHDQYNYVIVISGHEVDSITGLYLDGRLVYWLGSGPGYSVRNGVGFGGVASSGTYTGPDGNQYNFGGTGHSGIYCAAYYGDQLPGTVDGGLTANDPNWAADGLGNSPWVAGCTYIYLKVEYNQTVFPSAPEIKLSVRGKNNIWDPRTGTRGFSNNPALLVADTILDTQFGLGDTEAFQDAGSLAQLVAAANICDEEVLVEALSATTPHYEARYCANHKYDSATPAGNAIDALLSTMGGRISQPGGEWYIYPAAWIGPAFVFDESVIAGPIKFEPYRSQKDLANRISGTYTAANFPWNIAGNLYDANGFYDGGIQNNFAFADQPTDYPPYAADPLHGFAADEYLDEDSNLLGPWASGTTYNLGDVTSVGAGTSMVRYKSLIAANLGNNPAATSYPGGAAAIWQTGPTTYTAGQTAIYGGLMYIALATTTGNEPDTSPSDWALCAWVPYSNLLPKQLMLPAVQSVTQAQRLAKIELLRNRFGFSGDFPVMQRAFAMQVCDVMEMSFSAMGWTEMLLELAGVRSSRSDSDGAPLDQLDFHLQATDPSIYEWDPALEELTVYDVAATPTQQNPITQPPTGMTLTSGLATAIVGPDGSVRPRIEVQWTTPADILVTGIQIQYQLAPGGVSTGPWIDAGMVDVSLNLGYISGVVAGGEYNVRIRSVRPNGGLSVWVEEDSYTVVATLSVMSQGINALDPGSLLGEAFAPIAFTGATTSGSAVIASVSSTTGMLLGQGVTGAGIPAGAGIATIGSGTITLSLAATATASGVALTGAGTAAIVPADGVGHFTASIGSLSVLVEPANYPLLEILQQQLYYVYYIDPNLAGGAVTAIATTNQADFLNKVGYYLIDSVTTPKWVTGTGGTGGIYRPTSCTDTGTRTTQMPGAAYDGNTSTYSTVSGNMNGSGTGSVSSTNGVGTWSGFASVTLPLSTLTVVAAAVGTSDASIPYTLTANIGGTVYTLLSDNVSHGSTIYTEGVAAGIDLSTISVTASVTGSADGDFDDTSPFNQTASLKIYEIYIQ